MSISWVELESLSDMLSVSEVSGLAVTQASKIISIAIDIFT